MADLSTPPPTSLSVATLISLLEVSMGSQDDQQDQRMLRGLFEGLHGWKLSKRRITWPPYDSPFMQSLELRGIPQPPIPALWRHLYCCLTA
ncbi:hypothetical protein BGY98DRAFT_403887 [Russula aff. rugulosa BPL654]|nr:hypothetical protein BGY98DRAFT_403887 [Russula aff. rugulosa BPL654]